MDKKKVYRERKRQTTRKSTLPKTRKDRESLNFLNEMHGQGLEKIFLSPLTQKVLECRIGEHITIETRWVFIKKEKIEDNLFLHENSSEFLPIRAKIEKYPEPEMLIGSYSHIQDTETDFYLCTTVDIKDDILMVIENEKKNTYLRMWNVLHPIPRLWKDLGSRTDVDDSLSKKNRALFIIILDTEYPIPYHYTKFSLCYSQNINNSYTETFSGRFAYNLILRKRVDRSTQSNLLSEEKSVQSKVAVSSNKYVQYSYDCEEFEITTDTLEVLKMFFENKYNILSETLVINFNINLFCDDYMELAMNDKGISFQDPVELRSYQDVINCKHKKVSCISWNSLVSGMVAVAYTIAPIYYICKQAPIYNDPETSVHNKHLILLWMYKDNVRPKLYIHAQREVTALSFCPYDENILIGGYNNGQIVAWDITNRIGMVDAREVLTHLEIKHRSIMAKQTAWIKASYGVQHVFPTITSTFGKSHSAAITAIIWIPPCHYISNMGRYEQSQSDQEHMQFFTISLNGTTVKVWDLKVQMKKSDKKVWQKRTQRLSKLPDALTKTESKLKKLQNKFVPHYKLYVKDFSSSKKTPLTNMISNNQNYVYETINPETISDIEKRTYFRVHGLLQPFDNTQQLLLCSAFGSLTKIDWEGSTYNQGLDINSELCAISCFAKVHDGPIITCERNPFLPELLLTTGGSIFAIWDCHRLNMPLVWRKGSARYISGMWSFRHSLTLFMTRSDSYFEIWNFLEKSENPVRTFKYKGNQLISLFHDPYRLHVRKETFITSDIVGAIKIYSLPTGMINHNDSKKLESIEYVNHVIAIKKYTESLKEKFIKNYELAAKTKIETEEPKTTYQFEAPEQKTVQSTSPIQFKNVAQAAITKWQEQLELHMYNVLLEKKRLNVEEIERNRVPMQKFIDQENKKQAKINERILTREEDFKKIQETLLVPIESQRIRRKLTVTLSKEMIKIVKQRYYEDFKLIEVEAVRKIHSQRFKFSLNWNHMIQFKTYSIQNSK